MSGRRSRLAGALAFLVAIFVVAPGAFAQAPPGSWWSQFQHQCASVLTPSAMDAGTKAAVLLTLLTVVALVLHWLATLSGRLPVICVSVTVGGKGLKDATVKWADARGHVERKMSNGCVAIHDAGAGGSTRVKGKLTVEWLDVSQQQKLSLRVFENHSWRGKQLRRWLGGRNIVKELKLPLEAHDLHIDTTPQLRLAWRRPALPGGIEAAKTQIAYSYHVAATYTLDGDETERTFYASTISADESVSVGGLHSLNPATVSTWSVETTLAGVTGSSKFEYEWRRGTATVR